MPILSVFQLQYIVALHLKEEAEKYDPILKNMVN
jgi:hypothetical protein